MGHMRGCIDRGNIEEGLCLMGLDPSRGGEECRRRMSDTTKYEIVLAHLTRVAFESPVDQQDHTGPQVRRSMPPGMRPNRGLAFVRPIACPSDPLRAHRNRRLSG